MSVHCFLLALHSIILSNGASLETADFSFPARLDQQTAPYILSETFWHTLTRSSCHCIIILIIVHAVSINDLFFHKFKYLLFEFYHSLFESCELGVVFHLCRCVKATEKHKTQRQNWCMLWETSWGIKSVFEAIWKQLSPPQQEVEW